MANALTPLGVIKAIQADGAVQWRRDKSRPQSSDKSEHSKSLVTLRGAR